MDALKAAGHDRAHPEQVSALGSPVARGPGSVLFAAEHDGGHPLGSIAHRGLKDRHLFARRLMDREATFEA